MAKKAHKMGRPAKRASERLNSTATVKLTATERRALDKRAAAAGKTVSHFLRDLAARDVVALQNVDVDD